MITSTKPLRLLVLFFALVPAAAQAQQPTLQWELVNPFRFIHDQKTIDELRTTYRGLSDKSAFALERALQAKADQQVDEIRKQARVKFDCDHPKSNDQKRQCFAPYLGWFADLGISGHAKTCWDSKNFKFRNTGPCADYIYPTSHRVRVRLINAEGLGNNAPRWVTQPNTPIAQCEPKGFCIEFDVPYHIDKSDKITVAAEFSGQTLNLPIQVTDKLIVGLGDSYAAGEGNPDMPAQFSTGKDEHDFLADLLLAHHLKLTKSPQGDDDTKTLWLDRRCHRSMYSYQFKAALQLALANPQEAITYVTFSCAGATTPQIVNAFEKANEGGGQLRPQLAALHDVLQNGAKPVRPIDYLLLSTGGNDIGFATLVAFVVLPKNVLSHLRLNGIPLTEEQIIKNNQEHKFRETLLTGNSDCGNYRQLQKALFGGNRCPNQPRVDGIHIRDCETGLTCARIILTPYPDVFRKETNELCDGNRQEFDRPFTKDETRAHRIDVLGKNVFDQISAVLQDEIVKSDLGWSLVGANLTAYQRHGFCALNPSSTSETAEKFEMPRLEHNEWTSFKPWQYRAYETRQRWMRLPVDAKLTTNMVHVLLGLKIDVALEDDRSNIMHPTAEGLAKTADLNVETIRRISGLAP
jgi:hypothetical protein